MIIRRPVMHGGILRALKCLVRWSLLAAVSCSVAGHAAEPTRTWRQLIDPPYVVNDGAAETTTDGTFVVTAQAWTEWHLPAPGVVALALPADVNANQVLQAYRSNGSGLLAPVQFVLDAQTQLWRLAEVPYGSRMLHVRSQGESLRLKAFYLTKQTPQPPLGRPLVAERAISVNVRRHRLDFPERYVELTPGQTVRFESTGAANVRLRLRLPFAEAPKPWQDFRLSLRADNALLESPRLRAVLDRTQTWVLDGQTTLLSHASNYFLSVPEGSESLSLTASHKLFVQVEEVLEKSYLLPAWNQPDLAGAIPAEKYSRSPIDRILASQSRWQSRVELLNSSLLRSAPLLAAAKMPRQSGWTADDARDRERIYSRYTRLEDLLPSGRQRHVNSTSDRPYTSADGDLPAERLVNAQHNEYPSPSLLSPEAVGEPRWTNAVQRSSALNMATTATFVTLEAGRNMTFSMPTFDYPSRLHIIAEHSAEAVEIMLGFADSSTPTYLRLDPERRHLERLDPAALKRTSQGSRPPAGDATGTVELPVPAQSREVHLRNTGASAVTIALQVRIPRRQRTDEGDWIMLLDNTEPPVLQRWWRLWELGQGDDERWQAAAAVAATDDVELVGGWIPVMHYLTNQSARFAASANRVTPHNIDCRGTGRLTILPDPAAENWQQQEQWLNANERWRQILPTLAGSDCIQAHQYFARNLLRLGEHQLAEFYWRALILNTGNRALRERSIAALADYYQRNELFSPLLRLRAYVALRWRESHALQPLARALFDIGQQRFAVDVALLNPKRGSDARLLNALDRLAWSSLQALLQETPEGPADVAHFAADNLRSVGQMQLRFPDSLRLHDRLLDESALRLVAYPGAPVTATVTGPVRLSLALQPLVEPDEEPRGWAMVKVDDQRLPIPVSDRIASNRFEPGDRAGLKVATTTQRTFDLGPGVHRVEVEPESGLLAMAVRATSNSHETPVARAPISDPRLRVFGDDQNVLTTAAAKASGSIEPHPLIGLPDDASGWLSLLDLQPENRQATRELMAVMSYSADHNEKQRSDAITRGEWLAHQHLLDPSVIALRNRLRRHSTWQRVELLQHSGGIEIDQRNTYRPDSEFRRVRNLFLPPWQPGEQMLGSGAKLRLSLTVPGTTEIRLELMYLNVGTALLEPIVASVASVASLNSKEPTPVELNLVEGKMSELPLTLDRGVHDLEMALSEFPSSSLVKLRMLQRREGGWEVVQHPLRKRYVLAKSGKPAQFEITGPAWVRVDRLQDEDTISRYRYLASEEKLASLTVSGPKPEPFRVFVRQVREDTGSEAGPTHSDLTVSITPWPIAEPLREMHTGTTDMPQVAEPLTLLGMHGPTYTASVAWYADDQAQEDVRRSVRDYVETTITRHQRDAREGSFNEANAFIRQSSDGAAAFGTSAYYWRRLANTPFSLRADGKLLGQNADDGFAWAAHTQLILRHFTLSGRQRRHQTELRGFARYLSEDRGDSDLDPDIYSPYLRDHNSGVELMHRVSNRPTWDSELFAEMRVRSNELSKPTLDYIRSRFGGRSQLGPVQLGGEFQFTQYLEDQDRDDHSSVPRLNLLGRWYGAPHRAGRLELRGELSYDFNRDSASGWVRLLWHFDQVQGLDDFHGDRHWFDPLLTQRLLEGGQP